MASLFLDDIADLLSSGLSTSTWIRRTTVFTGILPAAAPDRSLLVGEPTGGYGSVFTMSTGPNSPNRVDRPRFQVWHRAGAEQYQAARQDAQNSFNLIHQLGPRTINGTSYLWMAGVQSQPFSLPPDVLLRPVITYSVDVFKYPSTSTST